MKSDRTYIHCNLILMAIQNSKYKPNFQFYHIYFPVMLLLAHSDFDRYWGPKRYRHYKE